MGVRFHTEKLKYTVNVSECDHLLVQLNCFQRYYRFDCGRYIDLDNVKSFLLGTLIAQYSILGTTKSTVVAPTEVLKLMNTCRYRNSSLC